MNVIYKLVVLLLAALALAPLGGCRRGGAPGTLVVAIELAPRGFDPRTSTTSSYSARIMQLIYDTLVVRDEQFEFKGWLAERFEESPDQRSFTFHLRQGVKFHDGKPLTSADVKYTFASLLDPAFKSPIRGAVDKITSIETPDPYTVVFRASEPFYTFMGNLPAIGIIPEGAGTDLVNTPVGTGPYRFVSYREGESVVLEANGEYWNGPPNIPRVHVKVVTDNSTRQAELMSGDVDLAYNAQFDPETIRSLAQRKSMQVVISNGTNVGYLGVNVTSASLLSNQRVRQAVAYAIDRDIIIERLLRGQARKANAILPPEHWAYEEGINVYDHDLERAKQLLDEAGFPDPDGDGPQARLEISILTSTTQLSRNIAVIIQDQLRRAGIQLQLESLESATLFDRLSKAQFDLYYLISIGANQSTDVFQFVYHSRYQNPEFNDAIAKLRAATDPAQMRPLFDTIEAILSRRDYCPNAELNQLLDRARSLDARAQAAEKREAYLDASRMMTDRGGQNRMRYCNPQVDQWIVDAERATDRAIETGYYSSIQKTVAEELPQVYLWYPANVLVARRRVGNIQTDLSGNWYFIAKLTLEDE